MHTTLSRIAIPPFGDGREAAAAALAGGAGAVLRLAPAPNSTVTPIRFKIGGVQAAYRSCPTPQAVTLTPSESMVYVILPTRGSAVAVTADGTHEAEVGAALLLGREDQVDCVWRAGSAGLILHLPRAAIQAEAARFFGEPRRLASIVCVFGWTDRPVMLKGPPFPVDRSAEEVMDHERALCASLIHALVAAGYGRSAFPIARSVMRAIAHVRTHPQGNWTVEDLAPIAGVTAATLRRNFRSCLGMTVTRVVRDARLLWVRQQLASATESRSIAELSGAAGFATPSMLARAYHLHFGETPSQTRARAFGAMRS
jgi:AraC-like DNA-binding protein